MMHRKLVGLPLLFLAACSVAPQQPDDQQGFDLEPVAEDQPQIRPSPQTSKAALALLAKARQAANEGQLSVAEAQLERALRIEPQNAVLWHYMAKLRLHQGQISQAAGLAAKSNSLDQGDPQLQADNWRIIAHARYQKGDKSGAQEAQRRAEQLLE
jgi:tetratricopeptide (TPR) repeat protein